MNRYKNKWQRTPKWVKVLSYTFLGMAGAVFMGVVFGFGLKLLWNWLMPDLFNLKEITYWQAIGIFILLRVLIGSFGLNNHDSKPSKNKRCMEDGLDKKGNWSNWRFYDEWWDHEGERAFTDYVDKRLQEKKNREDSEDNSVEPM